MAGVAIAALGHVSNVGLTVESTCAAQRAGIMRAVPITGVWTYDPTELEQPVVGASIPVVTEGFFQASRWVRMAAHALGDLCRYAGANPSEYLQQSAVLWVLPALEYERFRVDDEQLSGFSDFCCVQPLLAVTDFGLTPEQVTVVPGGSARVAAACSHASTMLDGDAVERVVVLATDSWLDSLSLMALASEGRLKDAENPVGLCPGEAGVCVALETASSESDVRLSAIGMARAERDSEIDPAEWRSASVLELAGALEHAVRSALQGAGAVDRFRGDVVVDLNGEPWKSRVWGAVQTRLLDVMDFDRCRVIAPAESFGDTGAASAAAALSVVVRSFVRGYASGAASLVVTLSDAGETSAVVVESSTSRSRGVAPSGSSTPN